jgi:hypothetical protein
MDTNLLEKGGYNNFIYVNKYYDFPWALSKAKKDAIKYLSFNDLNECMHSSCSPNVFSIFAYYNE